MHVYRYIGVFYGNHIRESYKMIDCDNVNCEVSTSGIVKIYIF